jgi:hypothetical protein
MKTNVDGVFYAIRATLPHLLQSKGSIVNVSSVSGLGGDWYQSFYNASKGAVSNLTRSLALELAPYGVRVNAVNPSLTLTEMTTAFQHHSPPAWSASQSTFCMVCGKRSHQFRNAQYPPLASLALCLVHDRNHGPSDTVTNPRDVRQFLLLVARRPEAAYDSQIQHPLRWLRGKVFGALAELGWLPSFRFGRLSGQVDALARLSWSVGGWRLQRLRHSRSAEAILHFAAGET